MTTLLNLLNASIECNNLGVILFNAGDLENALDSFMTAAKLMHPVSKQVQTSSTALNCDPYTINEEPGFEIPDGIRKIVQESADSIAANGKTPGTDNIFIKAEPVRLETAQHLPESCTLESAAVVYNMGLVYHMQGTEACLHRAIFLYDMAFNLSCPVMKEKAATVAMGSLNNAGQIFHQIGEYNISRRYLDTLRIFIMKLPHTLDSRSIEERHQFLLNAVLLRAPNLASAAWNVLYQMVTSILEVHIRSGTQPNDCLRTNRDIGHGFSTIFYTDTYGILSFDTIFRVSDDQVE